MMKIGIIGAGVIAGKVAGILQERWQPMLYAVASRNGARAEQFAHKYGMPKAYASYEALVSDPEVDIVYVATPHSHHYAHARLALMHGKHVICEKAFTANAAEARLLIDLARERGLFLMEAMWTRFMPITRRIAEVIESGTIGEPRIINASLCWSMTEVERIRRADLCGGALLDLGVYCLTFADLFMGGRVLSINSHVVKGGEDVDWTTMASILYEGGKIAHVQCSACCYDRRGIIVGERGRIEVDSVNWPRHMKVVAPDGTVVEEYTVPADEPSGYELEFIAANEALKNGWTEHPLMPHATTLRLMEMMDTIRHQNTILYPNDHMEK
ncbi:MAG: Gfo/Idh/MocA family oxidoreductase [Bacteroidales bacterium]|nr:Gfo/Idh/MocA family oxidoreductase [Bacteroidales bacterium]